MRDALMIACAVCVGFFLGHVYSEFSHSAQDKQNQALQDFQSRVEVFTEDDTPSRTARAVGCIGIQHIHPDLFTMETEKAIMKGATFPESVRVIRTYPEYIEWRERQ